MAEFWLVAIKKIVHEVCSMLSMCQLDNLFYERAMTMNATSVNPINHLFISYPDLLWTQKGEICSFF